MKLTQGDFLRGIILFSIEINDYCEEGNAHISLFADTRCKHVIKSNMCYLPGEKNGISFRNNSKNIYKLQCNPGSFVIEFFT